MIVYHNNVSAQEERMNKKRERVRGNDCTSNTGLVRMPSKHEKRGRI